MTKPKSATSRAELEIGPDGQLIDVITPDDWDVEQAANEMESVQGATVTIYRQGAHGRDWTFIDTITPAEYAPVMLKHPPYNGGKFRIVIRKADGTIRINRVVNVEPPPAVAAPLFAPASAQPIIANDVLARAMLEGFGRIGDAMARLGELIVTNRAVAPPAPPQLRDLLGDVQVLKDLIAPAQQQDPLGMLDKMLGIVEKLPDLRGGGDGGGKTEIDVLHSLATMLMPKIIEASSRQPQIASVPRLPLGARPTVSGAPPIQPGGTPQMPLMPQPHVIFLNFLVDQARRNNNPEPYAVVALDNVPATIIDQYVNDENWFEELCKIAPGARSFEPWFTRLRAHMVDYLTNQPEEEQTPAANNPVQGAPLESEATPGS